MLMNRVSIGVLLFIVLVIGWTLVGYLEDRIQKRLVDMFDQAEFRYSVEEFDKNLMYIMMAEKLLEIPNVERRCREIVSTCNSRTGTLSVEYIDRFSAAGLPLRLSGKDCE